MMAGDRGGDAARRRAEITSRRAAGAQTETAAPKRRRFGLRNRHRKAFKQANTFFNSSKV